MAGDHEDASDGSIGSLLHSDFVFAVGVVA